MQAVSFERGNSCGQSDAHEKACESLGEVFQVGRLQTPTRTEISCMCGEVGNRKTDNLTEINHLGLTVVFWLLWRRKEVEAFSSALSDLFPNAFHSEVWIELFKCREPGNRAKGNESHLPVLKVAALGHHDKIGFRELHEIVIVVCSEIRREVGHQAPEEKVALGELSRFDFDPKTR